MSALGSNLSEMALKKGNVIKTYLHRVSDLCGARNLPEKFVDTLVGNFDEFRQSLKRLRIDIPVNERDEWERYFNTRRAEVAVLSARIADAESEINDRVYSLFDLDRDEIASIEEEIECQY